MINTLAGFTAALALALTAQTGTQVGNAAPRIDGRTLDGGVITSDLLADRAVVLEWASTDCAFVDKHYSTRSMQTLQRQGTADGTVWITVFSGPEATQPDRLVAWLEEHGTAASYVLLDPEGQIARAFKAQRAPETVVIDREGAIFYTGAIDSIPSAQHSDLARADNYVRKALASLRAGEALVTRQSRSYGCPLTLPPEGASTPSQ